MSAAVPGGAIGLETAGQLASARYVARVLDNTLELGERLAGALARAVDLDFSSGGTAATDPSSPAAGHLARARQLAGYLDVASVRADLADVLALTSDREPADARELAAVLSRAHASAGQLAAVLARARSNVRTLYLNHLHAWALDLNRESDPSGDLGLDLAAARASAVALGRDLGKARFKLLLLTRTTSVRLGDKQVAPSAVGLIVTAARLLPAAERGRYAEEYQSELRGMTQAGTGRIGQLQYGLRQLCHALPMIIVLRSPRRTGAVP
jgi:hypothetical protein